MPFNFLKHSGKLSDQWTVIGGLGNKIVVACLRVGVFRVSSG